MGKSIEALINPELLIWARESAGLSLEMAAKKIPISSGRLVSWEIGDSRPTIPQLIKLGNVYKRPISVFYLPKAPKKFEALHDYRRLLGQIAPVLTPLLIYEMRKAMERRQIALELYELLNDSPPEVKFKINLADDPEQVNKEIRALLGIPLEDQVRWDSYFYAYNEWRRALENAGILVFQSSKIKTIEMRGFSISKMPLPVIVTNNQDFIAPKIFSLFHELAHILLKADGICEFEEKDLSSPNDRRVEVFCNHVAGAFLVPRENFLEEAIIKKSLKADSIDDESIRFLSNRYKVSRDVILRRLLNFGYISSNIFLEKKKKYDEEANRRAEQATLTRANKETFHVPISAKVISSYGKSLTHLILTSYYQEKITLSDVSDYLGIKLKHLPKIEKAMSKYSSYF